jgi:hypothetical protein
MPFQAKRELPQEAAKHVIGRAACCTDEIALIPEGRCLGDCERYSTANLADGGQVVTGQGFLMNDVKRGRLSRMVRVCGL